MERQKAGDILSLKKKKKKERRVQERGRGTSKANEGERRLAQWGAPATEGGYWGLKGSGGTDTKTTL